MAGWQMARALLVAEDAARGGRGRRRVPARPRSTTARFYAEHLLSRAPGHARRIVDGAESVTALPLEAF